MNNTEASKNDFLGIENSREVKNILREGILIVIKKNTFYTVTI